MRAISTSRREREREIRRNTSPRFAPKESTHNCVHLTIEIIVNEWNARWWWLETHVTARFTCPNTEGGEGRVLESSTILRALRNRALLHADPIHPVFIYFSIRGKKRAETHKWTILRWSSLSLSLSLVSYIINPFHPDWYVNWRVVLTELLLIPPMKTMKPGFTWSGHHFTETPPWWWHVAPWDKGGERRYRPLEISNPKVMDRSERERDIPRYAWKNVSSMGSAVWGPVFNPSSSSSRYLARVITPLPCFVKGRNGTT